MKKLHLGFNFMSILKPNTNVMPIMQHGVMVDTEFEKPVSHELMQQKIERERTKRHINTLSPAEIESLYINFDPYYGMPTKKERDSYFDHENEGNC